MFKHNIYNIFFLFLACFILVFSFIHQSQEQINKNLGVADPPPPDRAVIRNQALVPTHSNYLLPSAGILPTNPFYNFKMIRDRVGLMLTVDPDKRALLLLHYADKRIVTAQMLASLGYENQTVETAMKAEAYLSRAIHESPKVSKDIRRSWYANLKRAILKHEEILEIISQSMRDEKINQITKLHQNLDLYRQQVVTYSGEPFGFTRPEDQDASQTEEASPSAVPIIEPYM